MAVVQTAEIPGLVKAFDTEDLKYTRVT